MNPRLLSLLLLFTLFHHNASYAKLSVNSTTFFYNSQPLFLSGVNQAWIDYGNDFGNSQSPSKFCSLNKTLALIKSSGGNSVRIWLHIEGSYTPLFNSSSYVVDTDKSHTLISDMKAYLKAANDQDILVFFVLWNGAVLNNYNAKVMLKDPVKLQSYINTVLTPMVLSLSNEPALGGWEIMNEPEGSLLIEANSEPCYNTSRLSGSGAGWGGQSFTMKEILTFVNLQAAAIKKADPKTLVTVGSWSERPQTNSFGYYNYYSDACLKKAGGQSLGILDFFQIHTYDCQGKFAGSSPMLQNFKAFGLNKPLVIGEFNQEMGGGMSIQNLYGYCYDKGYNGAWGWTAESQFNNFDGIAYLKGRANLKVNLEGKPMLANTCGKVCSDNAPGGGYTCAQQVGWGKCGETWMKGYCCMSCFSCLGCS